MIDTLNEVFIQKGNFTYMNIENGATLTKVWINL
jgi:hypothetical protein